jgi:hypothetical protein
MYVEFRTDYGQRIDAVEHWCIGHLMPSIVDEQQPT